MTSPAAPAAVGGPDTRPDRIVPGWALRLALGLAALAASLTVIVPTPPLEAAPLVGVLLVMASVGSALAPGSVLPLAVLIGVIVLRAATPGAALDGGLVALVALLPAVHQLAGICAPVPPRSVCQWRAVRPAVLRYAVCVLPVEGVVLAVMIAAG